MRIADAPLRKITTRIYEEDYQFIVSRYGTGWQEILRKFVQERCDKLRDEEI